MIAIAVTSIIGATFFACINRICRMATDCDPDAIKYRMQQRELELKEQEAERKHELLLLEGGENDR